MIKKYTLEVSGKAPAYIEDKELEYIYDHAAGRRKESGFREYNKNYAKVSDYHELWFKKASPESLVGEYIIDLVTGYIVDFCNDRSFMHIYTNKGVYQPNILLLDYFSNIKDFSNSKVLTCKCYIEKDYESYSRYKITITTTSGDIFIKGYKSNDGEYLIGFREHKY